jgi:hypothetical protein
MRPASRTHVALTLVAVPALLLGVSACGTSGTKPVAAHPVAQSSTTTHRWDEKTLLPAMKAAIEKQTSVHVSIRTVGDSRMPMEAQGDVALHGTRRPDAVLTMDRTPMGGSAEVRVVGDALYLSMPPMTEKGKFFELRGGASSPFGPMAGPMHEAGPGDALAALQSALRGVTYVGQQAVQGEQLSHYRLTLDPRAIAKEHRSAHPGPMGYGAGMGMSPEGRLPGSMSADVWLDANALPHQVRLEKPGRGAVVMELSDWGKPVSIQAPPQQDVVKYNGQWPGAGGPGRS